MNMETPPSDQIPLKKFSLKISTAQLLLPKKPEKWAIHFLANLSSSLKTVASISINIAKSWNFVINYQLNRPPLKGKISSINEEMQLRREIKKLISKWFFKRKPWNSKLILKFYNRFIWSLVLINNNLKRRCRNTWGIQRKEQLFGIW